MLGARHEERRAPCISLTLTGADADVSNALVNLLDWCKREREGLQMQREMLHAGRFRIIEHDGSGQRDISGEHIEQIAANIAELDGIMADYEANR
jgi:hypothetical protein